MNKYQHILIKFLMACNAQSEPGVDDTGFGQERRQALQNLNKINSYSLHILRYDDDIAASTVL